MTWKVQKPARGKGWGGDKKGTWKDFKEGGPQPTVEAKQSGREEAATAREVAKAHAVAMARLMLDIANDPATPAPTRLDAANKLIERAEGKPSASVDVTTAGASLTQTIDRPPNETREQWIERRRREISTAALMGTTAGSAD